MKKPWVLSYPLSAQRSLGCPVWYDSSLCALSFYWFCHEKAQCCCFTSHGLSVLLDSKQSIPQSGARRREGYCILHFLSWTDSIKASQSLFFSVSKGPPPLFFFFFFSFRLFCYLGNLQHSHWNILHVFQWFVLLIINTWPICIITDSSVQLSFLTISKIRISSYDSVFQSVI